MTENASVPLLQVQGLNAWYGAAQILFDVSLQVGRGEVVALMGRNGAGKSTTLKVIAGLLSVGAVGLNVEDTVHSESKRLRSAEEHAALIGALRRAADAAGVHVVVNARTDLFLRADGDESDRVSRAVDRLTLCADAGADCLYPVGRHDPDTLRRLTSELPLPVNAIALPDQDDPASFGPLGVGRISFGPFFQAALAKRAQEILGRWG